MNFHLSHQVPSYWWSVLEGLLLLIFPRQVHTRYIFRTLVFEVWVENAKMFGNLSLSVAIASFLHLAFVYDLHYPKVTNNVTFFWGIMLMFNKHFLLRLTLLITCRRVRPWLTSCSADLLGMGMIQVCVQ